MILHSIISAILIIGIIILLAKLLTIPGPFLSKLLVVAIAAILIWSIPKAVREIMHFGKDDSKAGRTYEQVMRSKDLSRTLNIVYQTTARLNMRARPDAYSKVIYVLDKDQKIIIKRPFNNKGIWLLAETIDEKHMGYVHKNFVRSVGERERVVTTGKHFFAVFWSAVRSLFSFWTLLNVLFTIIISLGIYYGTDIKNITFVSSVIFSLSFIISRKMLLGVPITTFFEFVIFYLVGSIPGAIVGKLLNETID